MHELVLAGCTASPFGSYLKALGVLRLISEQADEGATGYWHGESFLLRTALDEAGLIQFFVEQYSPTPIVAPWNGASGFYPNDNKEGIDALIATDQERFSLYRTVIGFCRDIEEVRAGKGEADDERRIAILRKCRNGLPDRAIEWLDAAVAISADGKRPCAPVLGTGGNEGHFDYTNNFMSRIAALLIAPKNPQKVSDLLRNALFATPTDGLEKDAAGQYDPGRAGGANQGPRVKTDSLVNPWDLVLTLEGAVMWASGLYRRQGARCRSQLCSPFTVAASRVGYGSALDHEEARAEIWVPLWEQPVRYVELRNMLREGRASVAGRPARNGLEFAEAASSLGVDRGIRRFVRYSLLMRRGDSYVALPAGVFEAGYRSGTDRVREFQSYLEKLTSRPLPKQAESLKRGIETALFNLLQYQGAGRTRDLIRALGRLLRSMMLTTDDRPPLSSMKATEWLTACGPSREVRIAASLASLRQPSSGKRMIDFLTRKSDDFAWNGVSLPERMISSVERQLRISATREENDWNWSGYSTYASDTTLFIEGSVDDREIEDLLFAFSVLDWRQASGAIPGNDPHEVLPIYAAIRLAMQARRDSRVIAMLRAGDLRAAGDRIIYLLRVLQMNPISVSFDGSIDTRRLAAACLIPVKESWALRKAISMVVEEEENQYYESAAAG